MAAPLPPFVQDLSLTLATAGAVVLVAQRFKIPLIIGYLLAGFLVGPNIGVTPTLMEPDQIRVLSELGLVFLLFGLGLEFSFRKLISLGISPLIIGIIEIGGILLVGGMFGVSLWLPQNSALALGAILSISSTSVIVKLVQEKKLSGHAFAQTAIGVLIVEDLFAILFLLLFPLAAGSFSTNVTHELAKVLGVSTLWIFFGTILFPHIVAKFKRILTDEVLLIASLGLCLGVTLTASSLGVSAALAAFLTGSVLAETSENTRIEHLTKPIRDLFAAIFFVSIGMLIDPALIIEYWRMILIIAILVIVSKFLLITFSSILSGKHLSDSIRTALTMGQNGEFSIILTTIAVSSGLLEPEWEAIIVSSSLLTILITPILISNSARISKKVEQILPRGFVSAVAQYSYSVAHLRRASPNKSTIAKATFKWFFNASLLTALFLAVETFDRSGWIEDFFFLIGASILGSPFLLMMIKAYSDDDLNSDDQKLSFLPNILFAVITIFIYGLLSYQLVPDWRSLVPLLVLVLLLAFAFRKKLIEVNRWLFRQLSPKHIQNEISAEVSLGPWDEHLTTVTVNANCDAIEKTLAELDVRNRFGINIIMLKRGDKQIVAPSGDTRLLPGDSVLILGTDNEASLFDQFVSGADSQASSEDPQFELTSIKIEKGSKWENQSINSLNLSSLIRAVIVGVERGGERVLSPQADFKFKAKDFVWLVLDKAKLGELKSLL